MLQKSYHVLEYPVGKGRGDWHVKCSEQSRLQAITQTLNDKAHADQQVRHLIGSMPATRLPPIANDGLLHYYLVQHRHI